MVQYSILAFKIMNNPDRITLWLTRHYMSIFNLFIFIYIGLPFLAPGLMKVGMTMPANLIYKTYSLTCHQLAFRSWFLFGEQAAYPRKTAAVEGLESYEAATGFDTNDFFKARNFNGDDFHGYKIALCERDVAIYASILLFGLIFSLTGRKIFPLPWYIWVFIGIVPLGIDGVSQLASQLPLSFIQKLLPYRESTPLLRTLTGFLFGLTTAWFAYPLVEMSMQDTIRLSKSKQVRLINNNSSIE